jgi:sporulation integral membrane protein YtvI
MDTEYRRAANITVTVAGILIFLWLFFKYLFGIAIPFILAALIAVTISPVAAWVSKKTCASQKFVSAFLVIFFFGIIATLVSLAISRLVSEVGNLIDRLSAEPELVSNFIERLGEKLSPVGEKLGFIKRFFESEQIRQLGIDLDGLMLESLGKLMSSLTSALPSAAVGIVSKVPEAILSVAVLLISAFYFCTDKERIGKGVSSLLPDAMRSKLPETKRKITRTLTSYLKAYLLIMLLTFCAIFVGLSLLGVSYALLLSVIIAIVDVLPILGTGTVLIPWAIFSFASSNAKLGIGLLILYAAISLIRQLVEPKIVGDSLGIHPLATLASIYVGIKLIGLGGIFVGPIIALSLKSFMKSES